MRRIATAGWLGYMLLVALLSLPFYALGLLRIPLPLVPSLPLSAVMVTVPAAAALLLSGSTEARRALLLQVRGWPGIGWVLLSLGLMPAIFWLAAALSGRAGAVLPDAVWLSPGSVAVALLIFLIGAVGEELGWQGYAYPRMSGLGTPLIRALSLGVIWALWHALPFWEMGHDLAWMIWHGLVTVALRVLIVWLCESAGPSLTAAVLFHMASNAPWGAVANFAAFYDPRIAAVLLWGAVGAVVSLYGPGLRRSGGPGGRPA